MWVDVLLDALCLYRRILENVENEFNRLKNSIFQDKIYFTMYLDWRHLTILIHSSLISQYVMQNRISSLTSFHHGNCIPISVVCRRYVGQISVNDLLFITRYWGGIHRFHLQMLVLCYMYKWVILIAGQTSEYQSACYNILLYRRSISYVCLVFLALTYFYILFQFIGSAGRHYLTRFIFLNCLPKRCCRNANLSRIE